MGHLLVIGAAEVPDRTGARLTANAVAEASVSNRRTGWAAPAGTPLPPIAQPRRIRERITWHPDMPDRVLRNNSKRLERAKGTELHNRAHP